MTASSPSAARAAVDELEGLLAKATPEPWGMDADRVGGFDLVDEDGQFIADRLGSMDRDNAAAIVALRNLAPHLLAAIKAVDELHKPRTCSCGGRRWTKDENWAPRDYERGREREEGAGLVPCGFCNHGGWNTEQWDVDGAVSCEECDLSWPCDTATALRAALALAAVDVTETADGAS